MNSDLATILIVNWNGRQYLERCLAALFAQPLDCARVIMVDNGSTDDSCAWTAAYYPQVEIIRLPHNLGFAVANNLGIASATARYVITLNNDTEIERGWIESLIEAAESDPAIGSCASRIVLADRPDMLDSAGISIDRFGFAWQRGHGELDKGIYRESADVWGASAAAALYRRSMLETIGLFDEEFGSYYEDVDLAWRAHLAGWRCRYVPGPRVVHVHSATGRRDPDRKLFLLTRNRWWTIARNYPLSRLWFMWPLLGLADLLSLARGLIRQRNLVPLTARLAALQGMAHVWRTRPTH